MTGLTIPLRTLLCNLQESPPRWRTSIIRAAAQQQLELLIMREEDLNPFTVGGTICQSTHWWLKPFRPAPLAFKGEAELSQQSVFRTGSQFED